MTTYDAPHQVTDQAKLAAMIETILAGGELPPVVVNGYTALTGSHRCEAYSRARRIADTQAEQPAVEISNADYQRACLVLDVANHTEAELNCFCAAIHASATAGDVRDAVADQIHDDVLSHRNERRAVAISHLSDEQVAERYEACNG